jgi:hypothetical protein
MNIIIEQYTSPVSEKSRLGRLRTGVAGLVVLGDRRRRDIVMPILSQRPTARVAHRRPANGLPRDTGA